MIQNIMIGLTCALHDIYLNHGSRDADIYTFMIRVPRIMMQEYQSKRGS